MLYLDKILLNYLEEDIGFEDITTEKIIEEKVNCEGNIISNDSCILAGINVVKRICEILNLKIETYFKDGEFINRNTIIAKIYGDAKKILASERVILNILMRMSGIASETRKIVEKIKKINKKIKIASTRKTLPGFRYLDKKAVEIGLGDTHRFRLDDMILIKKNHIKIKGSVEKCLKKIQVFTSFSKKIEIEVDNLNDAIKAAKLGCDIIMLDNLKPKEINKIINELVKRKLRKKVLLEASGNINYENIDEYAKLDIDIISIGYITHSVISKDFSLRITKVY